MEALLKTIDATVEHVEYVPVMVPVPLVPEVYGLIARRSAELEAGESADSVVVGAAPGGDDDPVVPIEPAAPWEGKGIWPQAKLDQFARSTGRFTTVKRIAAVLDILAEHPDEKFPTSVLCEMTGYSKSEFKAPLIKLTRHIDKHYGKGLGWPLQAKWGPDLTDLADPNTETYYWIGPEQAERWKAARSATS